MAAFAVVRECTGGWEAYAKVGMRSGPWPDRDDAVKAAARWNGAVEGWPDARRPARRR